MTNLGRPSRRSETPEEPGYYTTPWFDMGYPALRASEVLLRRCEGCATYVRPGSAHICRVVPPGEPRGSQEGLADSQSWRDVPWQPPRAYLGDPKKDAQRFSQPPPEPGDEAVVPLAIEYLQAKADAGEKKYGQQLETFNGRAALVDALEDSADTFLYLYQACREKGLV